MKRRLTRTPVQQRREAKAALKARQKRLWQRDLDKAQIVLAEHGADILPRVWHLSGLSGQARRAHRSKFNQRWRELCNPYALRCVAEEAKG